MSNNLQDIVDELTADQHEVSSDADYSGKQVDIFAAILQSSLPQRSIVQISVCPYSSHLWCDSEV